MTANTMVPRDRPASLAADFRAALASEWTKVWSLRSTAYTLLVVVALATGVGALLGYAAGNSYDGLAPADKAAYDPTATSLQSFLIVQLAVSVLGVLVVTSEYATGMIRTSLAVVPRRRRLLTAKAVVLGTVALGVGQVAAFGSFLVGQAFLRHAGAPYSTLGEPEVLRAVVGAGLYLVLVALLGVAVGVLVRATAGAVVVMVTVTLLVPVLTPALPDSIAEVLQRYWPTQAGARILTVVPDPNLLSPWAGLLVLAVCVAATLVVATTVLGRRDA